ncbi:hypothetical protein [Komagataeibacter xylinus]|mgnify:CR=1 FL=1|uniref:Uncharacterized protein n=1 Tax=Komagataeibacter xylinus TaxID=28448 RepID=A0A857FWY4_KOMXY|nr:hypothetical protein [Komagataeibacter xylinus]QHC37374.1 hypothetical protein FMA36_17420 [Komagataeibacter xylinus]
MMNVYSINLIVPESIEIYLSDKSPAGTIDAGKYVAELNNGQQSGSYSLYEADENFVKGALKNANVHLSVNSTGQVKILE